MLLQYGFLLATAPLTQPVRRATVAAIALLPGIRLCGAGNNLQARGQVAVCGADHEGETEISLDKTNGTVASVTQRIAKASPLYPDLKSRAVIASYTFRV
jgi:hypothetical protein